MLWFWVTYLVSEVNYLLLKVELIFWEFNMASSEVVSEYWMDEQHVKFSNNRTEEECYRQLI